MRLYFLRHGLADRSAWDGEDYHRPLTSKGVKKMRREASTIKRLGLNLSALRTSPLKRARQTAELVAEALMMQEDLIVDDRLTPGFGRAALQNIARDHSPDDHVMLVGHEPDFSLTVEALIGGGTITFKKGGLARVDIPHPGRLEGELVWLIPPKVLALG